MEQGRGCPYCGAVKHKRSRSTYEKWLDYHLSNWCDYRVSVEEEGEITGARTGSTDANDDLANLDGPPPICSAQDVEDGSESLFAEDNVIVPSGVLSIVPVVNDFVVVWWN